MTERSLVPTQCFFALFSHNLCPLQTLTINGNPRLAYVHSGAITDVPRLAALDLSRNALFALESALPARFPASSKLAQSFSFPAQWLNQSSESSFPFPGQLVSLDQTPNPISEMLSRLNLTSLMKTLSSTPMQALKALYLSGNSFHCHCGLRWISEPGFPGGAVLQDRDRIMCHPGSQVGKV